MDTPIIERFAKGDVIVTEGIMSQKAYIIMNGEVAISKKIGKRSVTVSVLKKGDIFGEMGLFQETIRSATVIARGDVEVGLITKERFHGMLGECPDDLRIIVDSLVNRLRNVTERLAMIGLRLEQAKRSIEAYTIKDEID